MKHSGKGKKKNSRNTLKSFVVPKSAKAGKDAPVLDNSISDGGIANRNRLVLEEANEVWEFRKLLGLAFIGDENEVVEKIKYLKAYCY